MSELGILLRNARFRRNLFQREVADRTGVPRTKISHYERGRQLPSERNLDKMLKLYSPDLETKQLIRQLWEQEKVKYKSWSV